MANTYVSIESEIHNLWRTHLREIPQLDITFDDAFLPLITKAEYEATVAIRSAYPTYLRILEEGIRWLAELYAALDDTIHDDDETEHDDRLRAVWSLVGCACAYGIAVRRLVLSGLITRQKRSFDRSAKR